MCGPPNVKKNFAEHLGDSLNPNPARESGQLFFC
jgi:hypothetical protein